MRGPDRARPACFDKVTWIFGPVRARHANTERCPRASRMIVDQCMSLCHPSVDLRSKFQHDTGRSRPKTMCRARSPIFWGSGVQRLVASHHKAPALNPPRAEDSVCVCVCVLGGLSADDSVRPRAKLWGPAYRLSLYSQRSTRNLGLKEWSGQAVNSAVAEARPPSPEEGNVESAATLDRSAVTNSAPLSSWPAAPEEARLASFSARDADQQRVCSNFTPRGPCCRSIGLRGAGSGEHTWSGRRCAPGRMWLSPYRASPGVGRPY